MAAVDDYLEVRPEQTEAVRALVARGQLAIGPWRVLMDEFLCSGETMIRNLEMGWADAARLGAVMPIGYLPDMFGHCAQMPQLLRHVGIEQAVVYRGVPAEVDCHEFWWRSPDGTGIRTEFLANSYGNAADVFGSGAARERLAARLATQSQWYAGDFLAMYGTDHAAPLPSLMAEVAELTTRGRGRAAHPGRHADGLPRRAAPPARGPARRRRGAAQPRPRQHPARRALGALAAQGGDGPHRAPADPLRRAVRGPAPADPAGALPGHGLASGHRLLVSRLGDRVRGRRDRGAGPRPPPGGRARRPGRARPGSHRSRGDEPGRVGRRRQSACDTAG